MLTDPLWPSGYDLIQLNEIDSTNSEAARRAASISNPTWIRADRQTAGRGRSGRPWSSQVGNLFATLVYRPKATAQEAALRSFVAALALYQSLCEFVSEDRLALKWPNDVLMDDGKVAGILLETETSGDVVSWLAVGIGVNLKYAPQADANAAISPVSLNGQVAASDFLVRLAHHYAREELRFEKGGFAPVRERWLSSVTRLGQTIVARTANETIEGIFATVDETGALRLDTVNGPRSVTAGDVYFR